MKLRVPGAFTGEYGVVPFKDGVSTRLVTPGEANLLRAIMTGVEVMQDDGETVDEVLNATFPILPLGNYLDAGVAPPSPYLTQWDGTYPDQRQADAEPAEPPKVEAQSATGHGHTRAELEKIADEKGIAGLREIAEPLGIRSKSITALIDAILGVAPKAEPDNVFEV